MSLFYDESLCLYFVECQRCSVHNFVTSSDQEGCTLGKIWGLRILSELLLYSFFGYCWLFPHWKKTVISRKLIHIVSAMFIFAQGGEQTQRNERVGKKRRPDLTFLINTRACCNFSVVIHKMEGVCIFRISILFRWWL